MKQPLRWCGGGREVLSNVIHSQIGLHKEYGGVVPELASRQHIEKIHQVVGAALEESGLSLGDMAAVAVTYGPGLVGSLLVGLSFAKALAFGAGLPLVGVHHIEGHIAANFIQAPDLEPPFLCLVASGGHSHLVWMEDHGRYRILGQTRDDAPGEAFDKVARSLGLGYPGGPAIDRISREGDGRAIRFPRARVEGREWDFSFSGLKSAVLNYLNQQKMRGEEVPVADVAASFQQAVVDVLTEHSRMALCAMGEELGYMPPLALAGGVAANRLLRQSLEDMAKAQGARFVCPVPALCTDNGAMIASAGYFAFCQGRRHGMDLNAYPVVPLDALVD